MKVLIVSPRFAPENGADTHRVRLLLKYFSKSDCVAEVLCIRAEDTEGVYDSWLREQIPKDIQVHEVRCPSRYFGLSGLAQRCLIPLYLKGAELLRTGTFDVVFFSTTLFSAHLLGPLWKSRFGVEFCMDYQDPWVNDYYHEHPEIRPPGGKTKYFLTHLWHALSESWVTRHCGGYLSVSKSYLDEICARYGPSVENRPMLVRPFPAEPSEISSFETAPNLNKEEGLTWRYVGRGGGDMSKSASAFFMAWDLALARVAIEFDDVTFEAIGTSYDLRGEDYSIAPLAAKLQCSARVIERPRRISYSSVFAELLNSDALIAFGSDDPSYTASKLYPYLVAKKPVLLIFHEDSSVTSLVEKVGGGVCVTFNEETTSEALAKQIFQKWFETHEYRNTHLVDAAALEPFTAEVQASEVCSWLRQIVDGSLIE